MSKKRDKQRGKIRKRYSRVPLPILRTPFIETGGLFRRAVIIPQLHGEDCEIDVPVEKLVELYSHHI